MNQSTTDYILAEELDKAAYDHGFPLWEGSAGGWRRYRSTTAPGSIALAAVSPQGPCLLSLSHAALPTELDFVPAAEAGAPYAYSYRFADFGALRAALARVYELSLSLPDTPLSAWLEETRELPRSTEAERLMIARLGQDRFRQALLAYWGHRCPLTGITDAALLRASHIIPWAECASDALRLDVHNGLLLSALYDAAFDAGLISFLPTGEIVYSPELAPAARGLLVPLAPLPLRAAHQPQLAWHRARHGFGD